MARTRNYASIIYLDSAPENWRDILNAECVPMFISPFHDQDTNPTGEPKKPHYHILICFDSVKTVEQAKEIFEKVNAVGCEVVKSLRGYARYLCHLDNPEKVQYPIEDVISMFGADYPSVIGLALDKYKAVSEMIEFIDYHGVMSYAKLLNYARKYRFDWFRLLCDNSSYVIQAYLKSRNDDITANTEQTIGDVYV